MLKYRIATFVLVCSSRVGQVVGPTGTVSELFAKMLFFLKMILCERSEDRKIQALIEHCYMGHSRTKRQGNVQFVYLTLANFAENLSMRLS